MMLKQSPFRPFGQAGSGNATVPNDAPIQPPQAFVDNIVAASIAGWAQDNLSLPGSSITYIKPGINGDGFSIWAYLRRGGFANGVIDLSGNAITNTNAILAACVDSNTENGPFTITLDLSGGTNAAPTGQGIADKNTLISNGWTVTTN